VLADLFEGVIVFAAALVAPLDFVAEAVAPRDSAFVSDAFCGLLFLAGALARFALGSSDPFSTWSAIASPSPEGALPADSSTEDGSDFTSATSSLVPFPFRPCTGAFSLSCGAPRLREAAGGSGAKSSSSPSYSFLSDSNSTCSSS